MGSIPNEGCRSGGISSMPSSTGDLTAVNVSSTIGNPSEASFRSLCHRGFVSPSPLDSVEVSLLSRHSVLTTATLGPRGLRDSPLDSVNVSLLSRHSVLTTATPSPRGSGDGPLDSEGTGTTGLLGSSSLSGPSLGSGLVNLEKLLCSQLYF